MARPYGLSDSGPEREPVARPYGLSESGPERDPVARPYGLSDSVPEREPTAVPKDFPEAGPGRRPEYELPVEGRAGLSPPMPLFDPEAAASERLGPIRPGLSFCDDLR